MNILCCIKQVYDLDIILEKDWLVDENTNSVDVYYANRIINPFDETAIEMMLRLQDKDSNVTSNVLTVGEKRSDASLIRSLASGVTNATRIDIKEDLLLNPNITASAIYQEIHNQDLDLILCGRQSDINNFGQTGQILAKKLGWSCFTNVFDITHKEGKFYLSRLTNQGIEHIITEGPLVVTITQTANMFLRMATLRDLMQAKKQSIKLITKSNTKIPMHLQSLYKKQKLTIDNEKKNCEFINVNNSKNLSSLIEVLKAGDL